MVKIKEICQFLETLAPLSLQESYDNAGLIIGNPNTELKAILISLDVIEETIDEAIEKEVNLIISHHPIIFSGLKKINGKNSTEKIIIKAIQNNIAIYASHTNLDSVLGGVNDILAQKLNLKNTKFLRPKKDELTKLVLENTFSKVGEGMIGELEIPLDEKFFFENLKKNLKLNIIRHTKFLNKKIKKIAICGGSGSFLIKDAISQNADVFITGDIKYHQFFEAENKIILADIGHYESEIHTKNIFYELLSKKLTNFAIYLSDVNTNPIFYF